MFPIAARVVKDWYHEGDQALGVGIWNAAPPLGTAFAPALLTPVMMVFGWRWMFVLMALIGMGLCRHLVRALPGFRSRGPRPR